MKAIHIVCRAAVAAAMVAATTSCGDVVRSSKAPVLLVINKIVGVRGASTPGQPGVPLVSDVITMVTSGGACTTANPCPTFFNDTAVATLSLEPKDLGLASTPATPSSNNQVTITRVHVSYTRTDGKNQQGVDVPFEFDSGVTALVPATGSVDIPFEVVRNSAKLEEPLLDLRNNGVILSMIANLTFYGTDLVGNAISVTGTLQIDFGNFADPQ
ncbi:MAG TPA: hypothetical protein VLV86_21795 [Vicinamibacterales bacterium]|nr:hypothetical protein [Vicinamibacterales bacterium]